MSTLLEKEVTNYCQKECKKLFLDHLNKKKVEQSKVVHNVKCNGCGCEKIEGVRYKCTSRFDYNLCERCEENVGVDAGFAFIKIRKPDNAPIQIMCQYGNRVP